MAMDRFATVEVWDRLKSFVLEDDGSVAQLIEDRQEADWGVLSTSETQVLALMAALGMDLGSPADRRRARRLLGWLAAESEGEVLVAEEPDSPLLKPRQVETLRRTLRWIAENPPARFLATAAGPQAAIREIHKNAPSLAGLAGYRWLVAMGYPCAIPDLPRRRWISRFGLMEITGSTSMAVMQRRTLGVLEEFAQSVHAPLCEVDTVLGRFTGATGGKNVGAALCGGRPQCEKCPLRPECRYYAKHEKSEAARSRNLAETMREGSRPRERLLQNGAGALTEEELLAIVLRTGGGGLNVVDVATQLMTKAVSLERLASMSISELASIKGVGEVKAVTIKAALELARRLRTEETVEGPIIGNARQIYKYVEGHFVGAKREEFMAMLLDVKKRVMRVVPVSLGTLNHSLVHPREAFADAIRDSAHSVVFIHNHPTGDPTPSQQDEAITRKLVAAGDIVGIRVVDHVIVGRGRYFSFCDAGKIDP